MKRLTSALVFLFLAITGLADGKFYSSAIALHASVTIPDQRALIHFSNGVELLVIDTRFTGSGTNFAWVIPLPAEPIIEAASAGVFPTLQHIFRPRITHHVPHHSLNFLALVSFAYLLVYVRPTRPLHWLDFLACLMMFPALGRVDPLIGLLVLAALLICVVWIRVIKRPAAAVFIMVGFIVLLVVVGLPRFARSRAGGSQEASASQSVAILDRKLVGIFETATITSRTPKTLQAWLRDNGFVVTTNTEPVIDSYAKDGWVFVAVKVRRDRSENETSTPHPLSFTFKTDKPVYPMRLTGVDNGDLQVELYVFGPARAKAANFDTIRCTHAEYPQLPSNDPFSWSAWLPSEVVIVHPLLRKWLDGTPVVTKLSATLSPAQMKEDVWLEWTSFAERGNRVFSSSGALTTGANWGAGVFATVLIVAYGCWNSLLKHRPSFKLLGFAMLAGIVVSGVIWLVLPKTEVRLVKAGKLIGNPRSIIHHIYWDVHDAGGSWSLNTARAEVKSIITVPQTNAPYWNQWAKASDWANWQNYYLGGPLREEDSPGNYLLREKDGRIQFLGYDSLGAEHVFHEWPSPEVAPPGQP